MPTTPTLLLPYPAPPDPADVPADMQELADRIEAVRGGAAGLAPLDAGAKVPIVNVYAAVPNGLATLGADGKVPASQLPPAPTVPTVPYGTAFPAAAEGQECIIVDNLATPNRAWRFRYSTAVSDYKWVFIGGSPMSTYGMRVTYSAPYGVNCALVAPYTGVYLWKVDQEYVNNAYGSCRIAGATVVAWDSSQSSGGAISGGTYVGLHAVGAGTQFDVGFASNGSDAGKQYAAMTLTPVRVA